jgi:hypothetical protein
MFESEVNDFRVRMNRLCDLAGNGSPLARYIVTKASAYLEESLRDAAMISAIRLEVEASDKVPELAGT